MNTVVFIIFLNAILIPGSVTQSDVQQSDTLITISEGRGVQMNCSYTFPSIQNLQWYRQHGSRAPQLIVLRAVSGQERSGNSAMILNEKDKWSRLDINETQNPDSAVYYCAVRPNDAAGQKLMFGNGTKLTVNPKKKSETAAFVLGSDEDNKKGKARACLITDFSSHDISVTLNHTTVSVDPSVIEGEEQYSVVAFLPESKERSNFSCNVFVNGTPTEGNNTDIENVCVSDLAYVFESDENLNSLSLMVLGLRVIFLKSIVFNVLMTVRAWMS